MEKVENTIKNGILKKYIILFLVLSIVILIGVAYARYITRLNGSTQVPIAQWNFKVTAGSSQSLDIDLASTRFLDDTQEVDRTKVAPGTSGALQLNINATGSQVSLEYDIDLSLTQIPENLIFYSDAEMTKALYKENGVIHLDGYFGASDTNKTATQNLYWRWKLETGSTQAEINANDLLDSEWIGDRIVLGVQATGRQVTDSPQAQYAVTFDLNGGTLANHGDSTQITKQVTYGENYGVLPTPTRDGYTFKGWNGKNLLNANLYDGIYAAASGVVVSGSEVYRYSELTELLPSGSYVISCKDNNIKITRIYLKSSNSRLIFEGLADLPYTFELSEDSKIGFSFRDATSRYTKWELGDDTINAKIQLEEGSTATAYEPYYITSSTEVVQNHNHTLTAIWEKDE